MKLSLQILLFNVALTQPTGNNGNNGLQKGNSGNNGHQYGLEKGNNGNNGNQYGLQKGNNINNGVQNGNNGLQKGKNKLDENGNCKGNRCVVEGESGFRDLDGSKTGRYCQKSITYQHFLFSKLR